MSATLFASALLLAAQAAAPAVPVQADGAAASEAQSSERTGQAPAPRETVVTAQPAEPTTFVDLGLAPAPDDAADRAANAYAAAAPRTGYRLQAADGSFADTRSAARRGRGTPERADTLAALDK